MKNKSQKIVLALGGNALGNTPIEQEQKVKKTAKVIADLIEGGHKVIVSHGNGPQVGIISLAFEAYDDQFTSKLAMPLSLASAMSQGYIGIQLNNAINNELIKRKLSNRSTAILTQTLVDENDPMLQKFTKPIGKFYKEEDLIDLKKSNPNWVIKEDSNRGYRRYVPSPIPKKILEEELIMENINNGKTLIVGGGGGIPTINKDGMYQLLDAVIDKDLSSELIAEMVDADLFIIATAVDYVYLNFGLDNQIQLQSIDSSKTKELLDNNVFPEGSMKPKIEAALKFVENKPNKKAIICSLEKVSLAMQGESGTILTK